jgi:hypothetical protein
VEKAKGKRAGPFTLEWSRGVKDRSKTGINTVYIQRKLNEHAEEIPPAPAYSGVVHIEGNPFCPLHSL